MNEDHLRELVRQALRELIGPRPRRALVVFTGGLLGFEDAIVELKALAAAGVELDYVQSPSAKRILDQDLIASVGMREASKKLVESHQMLIAPTLTSNIAAKVAHGIADCLASNLFAEFIMTNRLVVVSRTAICPDDAPKKGLFPQMPAGYADLLRSNLAALESFGARVVDVRAVSRAAIAAWERVEQAQRAPLVAALGGSPAGLMAQLSPTSSSSAAEQPAPTGPAESKDSTVVTCSLNLISNGVIQQLPEGTQLRIRPSARVTAMARDLAALRSIRILQEA